MRVPFRLGLDALLTGDAISRAQVQEISRWALSATGGDPANIRAGRELDGTLLSGNDFFTTVFAAPLGVAAMNEPTQQQWLNDIYDAVRVSDEGYYEDTISLLCLLVMTGNYWNPSLVSAPSVPTTSMPSLIVFALLLLATSWYMLRGRLHGPA